MESHRDQTDIAIALRALRPTPSPEFAAGLDARVAAGFPRGKRPLTDRLTTRIERLRAVPPRRLLGPAGAVAVTAVVIATAVVATSENGNVRLDVAGTGAGQRKPDAGVVRSSAPAAETANSGGVAAAKPSAGAAGGSSSSATELQETSPAETSPATSGPYASETGNRDIERSAQIVLGAEPADVRDDAARVFEAVHAAHGIVLNSSIRDGAAGEAGARFELLIPAAKVSDALASFSAIADVVSRHESTQDITAPTVGVTERLEDSDARVRSLLDQLAGAETDSERAVAEAELHAERRHQAALRSRLSTLHRRANLSRVSLRIETGSHSSGGASGAWGIGDGLDDAGRILAVAAGVVVIGLAILAPFALIALLAWLAHGAWLRRARRRALARV
jgi:Domain of unknown function (DUF4349)